MLDAAINLGQRIRSTLPIMKDKLAAEIKRSITVELDDFDAEVKYYKRGINELLQRSSEAANLVSHAMSQKSARNKGFIFFQFLIYSDSY
jgi:hypothetical protein